MIEYDDEALFHQDGISKQLSITYDEEGEITNSDLASEDFCLTEKLTANGTFVLGECNSAYIEFSVGYGTEPLEGKELTVTTTPTGGDALQIGIYTVVSDKPTADRRWRKITAYDALYAVLNKDVTAWYNTVLPVPEEGEEPTTITIKDFRDSFFEEVGITQDEVDLPNDAVEISRQADFTQLTGKVLLNAICEINGCFGRIGRDGVFYYTFLHSPSEPLYPAIDLYPMDTIYPKYADSVLPTEVGENGKYISAKYEDYFIEQFTGVQIRNDKNDVGTTVGSGQTYTIDGNFLAYGLAAATLTTIANNVLSAIEQVYFCPAEIQAQGDPCLEIGDAIVLHTRYATVETYLFQRKLKGIQSLIDTYTTKGAKDQKKNLNSTASRLTQTDGKINEVKADLVTAKKVIAEQIEADEARIGYIESNYVQTSTLVANYATITSLQTVDGKIDNLTSIAITTQNLSAQTIYGSQISGLTISAGQITSGTISADRLDASVIRTKYLNACAVDPHQGQMDIGVVRLTELWVWNGTSYERKY
jgi:hypothetical protein